LVVTTFLGTLSAAGWARADNVLLRQGITAYNSIELHKARNLLNQARHVADSSAAERAQVFLYLGLVHFTLGEKEAALVAFGQALDLDGDVTLPATTSPKIQQSFAKLRRARSEVVKHEGAVVAPQAQAATAFSGLSEVPASSSPVPHAPAVIEPVRQTTTEPVEVAPGLFLGRTWTWVTTGAALAALAVGTGFGVAAHSAKNDFDAAQWAADAQQYKEKVRSRSTTANVFFVVGIATLVGAVVAYFVEGDTPPVTAD
jgi:hypothetical protein